MLNTLEHAGYVVRLRPRPVRPRAEGAELYRLFHRRHDLVPAVRPLLGELAERAEEDAYLAVFRDGEVVVAEVVGASRALHVNGLEVGFTRIAHTTAIGKVLLASAPDDDLDDYLRERRLVPYTHRTLVERRHIKRHLRVVRERGIGKDLEDSPNGAAASRSRCSTGGARRSRRSAVHAGRAPGERRSAGSPSCAATSASGRPTRCGAASP